MEKKGQQDFFKESPKVTKEFGEGEQSEKDLGPSDEEIIAGVNTSGEKVEKLITRKDQRKAKKEIKKIRENVWQKEIPGAEKTK